MLDCSNTLRIHVHCTRTQDYNNTLLVSYLGCVTKGMGSINELIDKYNSAFDRGHSRRRGIF